MRNSKILKYQSHQKLPSLEKEHRQHCLEWIKHVIVYGYKWRSVIFIDEKSLPQWSWWVPLLLAWFKDGARSFSGMSFGVGVGGRTLPPWLLARWLEKVIFSQVLWEFAPQKCWNDIPGFIAAENLEVVWRGFSTSGQTELAFLRGKQAFTDYINTI